MTNILPYQHKKAVERLRLIRVAAITLWAFTLLMIAALVLMLPLAVAIRSRLAIFEGQLKQLEVAGVVVDPGSVAVLQSRAAALEAKLAAKLPPAPMHYIMRIREAAPGGIRLTGFLTEEAAQPQVEIAGVAATRQALQQFISAIETEPSVAAVESPVANYVKSTNSPFSITITFK